MFVETGTVWHWTERDGRRVRVRFQFIAESSEDAVYKMREPLELVLERVCFSIGATTLATIRLYDEYGSNVLAGCLESVSATTATECPIAVSLGGDRTTSVQTMGRHTLWFEGTTTPGNLPYGVIDLYGVTPERAT